MHCGQLIRKTGRYAPERLAVWMDGQTQTYGELYERSCRLVNALRGLGIEPQDRVGTLGPNALFSLEQIAGLALGGYVRIPLHYRNTIDLHRFMLEHTGARVLMTDAEQYEQLRGALDDLPNLEYVLVPGGADGALDYDELLAQASPEDANVDVRPEFNIHMAFTSGTTGKPKATVQSHATWMRVTAENMIMLQPMTGDDCYLAAGPLSHAASTLVFAFMGLGASHVVMPRYDPARAAELIEQHRVTITVLVPTMAQMLAHEPSVRTRDVSSLRAVLATGAPITEQTIRDVQANLGDVLYLGYGQSEGIPGTILTPADIARGLSGEAPSLLRSAGRAVPGSVIKIMGEDGAELPPNELGEIAIDTPGNMTGFWNQPEETAKRFTPDRFILTRDIGYLDEQGYLFLADRKDDMIISGGFNLWPAEIENAIASHPAVHEVAVIGVPHDKWGETPRAVVVLHEGASATEDELIEWCRERIGSMKKPTSVVFREGPLPTSPLGKVLRRRIREQEWPATDGRLIGGA